MARILVGDLVIRSDVTHFPGYVFRVVETYKLNPLTFVTRVHRRPSSKYSDEFMPMEFTWSEDKLCTVCANCFRPLDQHVKGRCLFQSTELLR